MRPFFRKHRDAPPVDARSTDAELIEAVAAERVEALRLLHERYAPWLRARLSRRCADEDLVDDAIQDTFLAVWRDARRFRAERGAAQAWIWTIAIRRLVSALRRRRLPGLTYEEPITASAEDAVLLGIEHGDLGTALARLTPELRAALQATVLDGLTAREAAGLLGIPEGTVKTRVMRAKAQLRGFLA
ncbi:MAG: RNA polymerase sigma factor [Thermoactinospora sp.]|nr:RNA polymerase sigma factor [Thermoactinospora sp.]